MNLTQNTVLKFFQIDVASLSNLVVLPSSASKALQAYVMRKTIINKRWIFPFGNSYCTLSTPCSLNDINPSLSDSLSLIRRCSDFCFNSLFESHFEKIRKTPNHIYNRTIHHQREEICWRLLQA